MMRPRSSGLRSQSIIISGRGSCEEKAQMHVSTNRLRGIRSFVTVGCLALTVFGLPASAQSEIGGASPAQIALQKPICELQAVELGQDVPRELRAICGDRGLVLGPVSEFSVLANGSLEALLVDVQFQGERRILLLSIGIDGLPMAENLTGQLARAAGKGPMSAIDDVTVELAGFASDGVIGVRGKDGDKPEALNAQISVGQQLVLERARPNRGANAAQ